MTTYDLIAANKRKTWVLILGFSLVIIGLGWLFGYEYGNAEGGIILATMIATAMSLFGYFGGDSVALSTSGAKQIQKTDAPELWNVVENLAVTDGLPMPKVYIINDPAPNAFATGRKPEAASVAVTTGLLQIMDKSELEGVIAHELSHVKNLDIRVMTIVIVLVGIVTLLADWLLRSQFLFGGRRNNRDNGAGQIALILFLVGLVLSILSPLIAEIIKLAVSRQREYLADASGALLTRYPEGLASALQKLQQYQQPMRLANHATAHLYINNPFGKEQGFLTGLFSTHPPLPDRIARLMKMSA